MANLVLYRKYRPKSFSEFIGQEHIVQTLTNAIKGGMISHAYLFSGPRGTGKTTLARLFAKAVNCENSKGFEPCNQCLSCREIDSGIAMDLIEIDAASQTGVENIRELKEGIRFVPTRLKYKVFIIDESHQLSKSAANALLKTLEEPPSHAIFILATTEPHKMIATIISRCQRFDFRKLRVEEIVQKLERDVKDEGTKIEKPALELVAQAARGSIRDGESILGQVLAFGANKEIKAQDIKDILGLIETNLVSRLFDFIIRKDTKSAIDFLHEILEKGIAPQELAKALIEYMRQALLLKMSGGQAQIIVGLTQEEIETLGKQIADIGLEQITKTIEGFLEANSKIRYTSIPQLPIELAIIGACGEA